jgi:VanZ family protein
MLKQSVSSKIDRAADWMADFIIYFGSGALISFASSTLEWWRGGLAVLGLWFACKCFTNYIFRGLARLKLF